MTASAAALGATLTIVLDCVMTFFGSSANDAAFNAWVTDSTDSTNRGAAEGINAMMPLVSILVVFGGFMSFTLETSKDWTIIFSIIGGVVLLIGIMGIFTIQETPIKTDENTNYFANIIHGFKPSVIKNNPLLYFALVLFAVFGIAIQIFMPYLILYYEVSLGMENYVLIMAPAIILAAVFTALYGRVYDKKGFDIAIIPAVSLLALGFIVLAIFKGDALVFVGSLMMMCGYLSGMAVFGALIRDYTPENKAGMFQGLRIVAQVLIPGVIGPFIGSAVLKNADRITNNDGTTSFIPNANIFIAALVVTVILALLLVLVWYLKKKYFNKPKGEKEGEVI
jgi:MFS family permease